VSRTSLGRRLAAPNPSSSTQKRRECGCRLTAYTSGGGTVASPHVLVAIGSLTQYSSLAIEHCNGRPGPQNRGLRSLAVSEPGGPRSLTSPHRIPRLRSDSADGLMARSWAGFLTHGRAQRQRARRWPRGGSSRSSYSAALGTGGAAGGPERLVGVDRRPGASGRIGGH
jgi:hypothetical protein